MTLPRNKNIPYWGWEREYNLNPHPNLPRIPRGFENIIIDIKDVKEYTIRAGVNRDNVLRNFGDWKETIVTALQILMHENPRFERARITTSYHLLTESSRIFDNFQFLSLHERISVMKEISDWGYSGTENIFVITDGVNIVKTKPVTVVVPPPLVVKKHEMDEKYPHTCFECGKALQYKHAKDQAFAKYIDEEKFNEWWESENVEFYCCSCYRKKEKEK